MKIEQIILAVLVVFGIVLGCEVAGVFDKEPIVGHTDKEVQLMMLLKDKNEEIKNLKVDNELMVKDYERIEKNIGADSVVFYNSSRAYRDSLRASIFAGR